MCEEQETEAMMETLRRLLGPKEEKFYREVGNC